MLIAASFGIKSGTITALGMIVGLHSATSSRLAVASGIVVMAIADGLAGRDGHAGSVFNFYNCLLLDQCHCI